MTDGRKRAILIGGGVLAVLVIVTGVIVLWPSPKPTAGPADVPTIGTTVPPAATGKLADEFLNYLSAGNADGAAPLTDDPAAAQAAIAAFAKNTAGTKFGYTRTTSNEPKPGQTTASVPIKGTWSRGSGDTWTFPSPGRLDFVLKDNKWLVKWASSILYPTLKPGENLAVLGETGQAGTDAIVGDDGKALATWDGSSVKPVDARISPLIMTALAKDTSKPGEQDNRRLSAVDAAGKEIGEPLHGTKQVENTAKPVQSTLNAKASIAAQNAVSDVPLPTYLVAIKPSTGAIMAVAQSNAAGTALQAFNGQYQPGSTFKVITATAGMERKGLNADSQLDCPSQGTYNGRTIHNASDFQLGTVPMRRAFAKSCNTTFASIASQLPVDALHKAANEFGLNADYTVPGVTTELGRVDDSDSPSRQVENAIGQGTVNASPLGMAIVAATVVQCKAIVPKLRRDAETTVGTPYSPPSAGVCSNLRTMMTAVVQEGTATDLKGIPGVGGKTGTAEITNGGDQAHGWFIGFKGDMAFAVLVANGKTSTLAVQVAAKFLRAL
ncbi:penicillin-binding transpeptidase domain-containing protein [Actinocrispum sp. NPDC049592]|uniref:penicillin-binding transpeptidase domain-containing protein n=1 Tax=Actinocrispum sp. NPDC049592 TaxID=3154835 RepID=UPI00341F867A